MTKVIHRDDKRYPELLRHIPDAPAQLYYKGEWSAQGGFENCLAVVGSRRMTQYGKRVTEQIVGEVAAAGVTIISGFMYGVDATAHRAAVQSIRSLTSNSTVRSQASNGRTIAVMPCGIERVHPEHQQDLYEKILETRGLIVSEWEGDGMPQMWMYPKRNRIVAGLSKATLVVEAGLDSGSLITAALAKKYGRQVFAVPGPITSRVSAGTNALIQQGAILVSNADDILEFFDRKALFQKKPDFQQDCLKSGFKQGFKQGMEQKILDILQRESLEADLLARTLAIPAAELGTTLSLMELRGFIKQESGKYYVN